MVATVTWPGAVGQRVPQVPHVAVDLGHLDLVVGEGRAGHRIPVDEPLAAVDQPVAEQHEERLPHRGGAHVVHREARAVPVARRAHRLELVQMTRLVLVLPLLGLGHERLAADVEALHALGQQALLDDGLRGDAGVVGARHPQRVVAAHAVEADQHVLQRVVERVAQVQRGRDVRRRDEDRVAVALRFDRHRHGEHAGVGPPAAHRRFGVAGHVRLGQVGAGSGRGRVGAHRRARLPVPGPPARRDGAPGTARGTIAAELSRAPVRTGSDQVPETPARAASTHFRSSLSFSVLVPTWYWVSMSSFASSSTWSGSKRNRM